MDIVARDLRSHAVEPSPNGIALRASFDALGGNTTLATMLTEFGAERRGHRHLDEATTFIVSGHGFTEVRPDEDGPATRISWSAGDVFAIPANAWHRHEGTSAEPARQLTFKTTPLMTRLFGSRAFVRDNPFRFDDRYADSDTWRRAVRVADWGEATAGQALAGDPPPALEDRPDLGDGVATALIPLAGQRMLEPWLVDLRPSARIASRRNRAEEVCLVLEGSGRTTLFDVDGGDLAIDWSAGDLVARPAGVAHASAAGAAGARLLVIRNVFIDLALGPLRAALPAG